jgi:hypothetical protein
VPEAALLMDSRFLRAPVSRQYVLHGHTSTQFAPTPYGSGTGEEGAHSVILLLLMLLRHDQCTVSLFHATNVCHVMRAHPPISYFRTRRCVSWLQRGVQPAVRALPAAPAALQQQ